MRKLFIATICATAVIFAAGSAVAAMSGGLASPLASGAASLSATLAYGERSVEHSGNYDEARSKRLLFKGMFGIGNGMDVYAILGLTDLEYRDSGFKGSLDEMFGGGVRFSPTPFANRTRFVLDLQSEYFKSEDGGRKVKQIGHHLTAYMVGEFGAAGRVGYFYPFAGLRLSYVDYDNGGTSDYEGADNFGLIAGGDFFANPNVFFTTEFHLFNENAFYFTAGYRF
jgi:hypothetical protein